MSHFHVRFIINQLTDDEIDSLRSDHTIISKMILTPEDYLLFHYRKGDAIEVQTEHGDRMWCTIEDLEIVSDSERIILIFTLRNKPGHKG